MSAFDDNPFGEPASDQVTYGNRITIPRPVNTSLEASTNPFREENGGIPTLPNAKDNEDKNVVWSSLLNTSMDTTISSNTMTNITNDGEPQIFQNQEVQPKEDNPNIFTIDHNKRYDLEKEYESLDSNDTIGIVNSNIRKGNNWPPFPQWTRIKPCFYQDIDADIPGQYHKTVKALYRIWIAYVFVMSLNLLDGLIALFIGFNSDNGKAFGLALLYWAFCIPSSFLCWFRPAYKAFRNDGSVRFMLFFFVFSVQCLFTIFVALGIGDTGVFGWVNGIGQFTSKDSGGKNYFLGACCLVTALCSSTIAVCSVIIIIKIHKLYRYSGNSMAKARSEITSSLSKNKTLQDTAKMGANEVIKNQLQS